MSTYPWLIAECNLIMTFCLKVHYMFIYLLVSLLSLSFYLYQTQCEVLYTIAPLRLLLLYTKHIKICWCVFVAVNRIINDSHNTLRPGQNGRHFPDDTFKCIFLNENIYISINISLKFVPKVPINNIPTLVPIMAWRRPGDKPLSEPMMVRLPTHICVSRPQWVNALLPFDAMSLP